MEADDSDSRGADGRAFTAPAFGGTRERIGARLGAARVAAGVELADIARDTRVPLRHLRAIEADAHDDLPALPYSIGFVKSFARAVGVDADEAATQFRGETSKTAHVPAIVPLEPLDERRLPSRGLVTLSVALLVLVIGGLTAYGAGWFEAAPAVETVQAPPVSDTVVADPAIVDPSAPQAPSDAGIDGTPVAGTETPVAAPATSAAPGAVTIVANEDAWVRITAISPETGKVVSVRTGLLAKGERFDLPASPPGQRLWTGRAGALAISVGGRAIPPLGGPVETVKNVSLDPGDLAARIAAPAAPTPQVR